MFRLPYSLSPLDDMTDTPVFKIQYLYGKIDGPEIPAYCPDDGYQLKISTETIGFDPNTGQPITRLRADCTKRFKWGHSHFVQDEYLDWPRTM